jgi:predicted ATPase
VKLKKIRIYNYKGFRDSGPLELAPDFTVVVGKNNSGKSALLQSFRLQRAGFKPHLSPLVARDLQPDPASRFEVQVEFDWHEIESLAGRFGLHTIAFPVNVVETNATTDLANNWKQVVSARPISLELACHSNQAHAMATTQPSHGQFPDPGQGHRHTMLVHFQPNLGQWVFGEITGNQENLAEIAERGLANQSFVFDAERLNIDMSQPAGGQTLTPNASNLPTMLHEMQANPVLWERFKQHINEIFPSITSITTPPPANAGHVTICVWQVDTATMRDDLAIRLTDCGTGVGQVLAILYMAMTRIGNLIVIDEPNSFLHPGASRKLIEILKLYDKNQYVISTHSADLISAIQPEIIHRVHWDGENGESRVEQVDLANLDEMSGILDDLGVRLSDVFGADQVVWVEGQTEAKCFPILARQGDPPPPSGTVFAHVRATGDFESKSPDAKQVWDIYKRLTEGTALLPPVIAFSFDREDRSDKLIDDLQRESGGRVSFLPRRLLENYFLHCGAIAHAIDEEFSLHAIDSKPITPESIATKISEFSKSGDLRNKDVDWQSDKDWIDKCHGAKTLAAVFEAHKLIYSKIRHGEQLCKWIIANDPDHLRELIKYLSLLWSAKD